MYFEALGFLAPTAVYHWSSAPHALPTAVLIAKVWTEGAVHLQESEQGGAVLVASEASERSETRT